MNDFDVAALVLTLTAVLAWANTRFLKLPSAIGLMAIALCGSLAIDGLDAAGVIAVSPHVQAIVGHIDLSHTLLHGLLGLFLFAGALHIDLDDLRAHKWTIALLALGGTLLSTVLIGAATYALLIAIGHGIGLVDALLFGALISPTDPIAVLGIFRSVGAPHELEVQISGESLFNDGVGVVLFVVLIGIADGGHVTVAGVLSLFLREVVGGAAFGLAVGYAGFRMLRTIDDYSVEVLITIAMVVGGYAAADAVGVSAPIGAVVAGLVVGNQGRRLAMSDLTRQQVDLFWKVVDEILNAVLFLMIGLEATRLTVTAPVAGAAALAIVVVLAARLASVAASVVLLGRSSLPRHAITILTWGGLRGGISIALALSLPPGATRDLILVMTYAVVACSILIQGLTLAPLLRRLIPR